MAENENNKHKIHTKVKKIMADNPTPISPQKGQAIYSKSDPTYVYREPDITQRFTNIRYNRDDPEFDFNDLIGAYSGQVKTVAGEAWFSVTWLHRYFKAGITRWLIKKDNLDEKGNGEEFLEGWVRAADISFAKPSEEKEAEKAKEDAEYIALLKELTASKEQTPNSQNNYLVIGLILIFPIYLVVSWLKNKNQNIQYTQ